MKRFKINDSRWISSEGYRKVKFAAEDDLKQKGALVQIVEIAAGDRVAQHYHKSSFEYLYVISGACDFEINGETIPLKEGDMLLTEPGDKHSVHNRGEVPFRVLVFKTNAVPDDTYWS